MAKSFIRYEADKKYDFVSVLLTRVNYGPTGVDACGSNLGLGRLPSMARSVRGAGKFSDEFGRARIHYGVRYRKFAQSGEVACARSPTIGRLLPLGG